MTHPILQKIRDNLSAHVDIKAKESFQRFFKSEILCYGVRSPIVKKISKEMFREVSSLPKDAIFSLCESLFQSRYCEEAWIAASWVDRVRHSFLPTDVTTFERWIDKYVDDWAKCDTFCNHAVGAFITMFPHSICDLKRWALSQNPYLRRAAAVSFIVPAKKGMFEQEIFEIADILLLDEHDLVQKGYGWMLKEASRKHQDKVFSYVMRHKDRMPRTALRYAIERMPKNLREQAMARK
jgi:3-methyladenine DNA glycosylase AlkD